MFGWLFGKKNKSGFSGGKGGRHPMFDLALEDMAVKDDDVVLDLGFADFETARQLIPLLPRGRFLGVPPSSASATHAEQKFADAFKNFRADFKEGVATKIPYADEYVTCVLSMDHMHEWINIDKSLDEINRVLSPGGRLVLVWSQPMDDDTHAGRRLINPEHMKQFLHGAGFHKPRFRERNDGHLRYYQYLVEKP